MIFEDTVSVKEAATIQGLQIRCPRCFSALTCSVGRETLMCIACGFPMEFRNGIWHALPVERATYYARFIKDYEAIRTAEGRGSSQSSYYLRLPDVGPTDQNAAQWKVRATTFLYLKRKLIARAGSALRSGARVLDIGAGNGWLSYRLSQLGVIPVAIDLLINDADGLGAAKHYDSQLKQPFLRVQAEADRLPFCDAQFDAVIFNASFHYSENFTRTFREALRCLVPGGSILIADSPWYEHDESGWQMLAERRSRFFNRFGTFSDSIQSQEFLTDRRLDELAQTFGIRWERHTPFYGISWSFRPYIASLRRRREPSTFRIYLATKVS